MQQEKRISYHTLGLLFLGFHFGWGDGEDGERVLSASHWFRQKPREEKQMGQIRIKNLQVMKTSVTTRSSKRVPWESP